MNHADRAAGSLTQGGRQRCFHLEPLVLEFIGLPGAGKTAVAACLVSELKARGIACAERRAPRHPNEGTMVRRIRRATALLREHELTVASLRFAASVRPLSLGRLARALRLSGWATQFRSYATSGVEVIVLDQGPLQDVWSLTVPSRRWNEPAMQAAVRRLLHTPRLGRAFVYVEVDVETAAERLGQRRGTRSRFDRLSPAQRRAWLDRYERALTSVFEYAGQVTNAPCLRLDGTLPTDEAARNVARFLDDVLPATTDGLSSAPIAAGGRS